MRNHLEIDRNRQCAQGEKRPHVQLYSVSWCFVGARDVTSKWVEHLKSVQAQDLAQDFRRINKSAVRHRVRDATGGTWTSGCTLGGMRMAAPRYGGRWIARREGREGRELVFEP